MPKKRVFISFDYDHDNDLRGNLISQAGNPESPFNFTDWSVKEPITEKWKDRVRDIIRRIDLMIVICGEHTHDATGVTAEVTIAREVGKPYFLLKGRRTKTCKKPRNALRDDEMLNGNWKNLELLIAGER